MYHSVLFYNHFGHGDLFNSREFVKELMYKLPADRFIYAHAKGRRFFEDINHLNYSLMTDHFPVREHFKLNYDDVYINTWIGVESKYVLPGIGCTLEKNKEMYNDILAAIGLDVRLTNPIESYVPTILYEKIRTSEMENTREWVEKNRVGRKVLISNGNVQSCQADNFDFTPIIDYLTSNYKDILFIVSEKTPLVKENLVYTEDITKPKEGFDLNEISYLSLFCETIIGRCSGPYVLSQVKENFNNPKKVFMAFCYSYENSQYAFTGKFSSKRFWSNRSDFEGVLHGCMEAIECPR